MEKKRRKRLRRRENLVEKVERGEIYSPVPPLLVCKKPLRKTLNIRQMRAF